MFTSTQGVASAACQRKQPPAARRALRRPPPPTSLTCTRSQSSQGCTCFSRSTHGWPTADELVRRHRTCNEGTLVNEQAYPDSRRGADDANRGRTWPERAFSQHGKRTCDGACRAVRRSCLSARRNSHADSASQQCRRDSLACLRFPLAQRLDRPHSMRGGRAVAAHLKRSDVNAHGARCGRAQRRCDAKTHFT